MARNGMEMFVGASVGGAVIFTGLAVAGGGAASAPLVSAIPVMAHTVIGWVIAAGGALKLFQSFTKK